MGSVRGTLLGSGVRGAALSRARRCGAVPGANALLTGTGPDSGTARTDRYPVTAAVLVVGVVAALATQSIMGP